jgi:3-hydroxyacyl-[acyl-carrier-protein] dehydratase
MTNTFLLNDFYTIESLQKQEPNTLLAKVKLNEAHAIFKGHFEQMPVVPGVCQTQIIKELLQQTLSKDLILANGKNIKFTGMIIPTQNLIINIELTYQEIENKFVVDAKLFFENTIFTKFKGTFIENINNQMEY